MRAFGWMQDLGRSAAGKVVALLLALAMVFSYSNIFVYSAKAFAVDEGSEVTTEETTETTEEEKTPEVVDTVEETTETENETTEDTNNETTNDVVEDEEGSEGEEDSDDQTEEQTLAIYECTVEGITATWNPETSAITISGHSVLTKNILNQFVFADENGDVIDWKPIVTNITIKGDNEGKLEFAPKGGTAPFESAYGKAQEFGTVSGGFSLVIDGVNVLPQDSFAYVKNITSVFLANVNTMGISTFFGCENIETASISNVDTIQSTVFVGCKKLISCSIDNVSSIGEGIFKNYSVTGLDFKCENLTNISVSNVKSISDRAFYNTSSLQTATLSNINTLGQSAFANCPALQTVEMNNIDTIGKSAFYNCTGLTTVEMDYIDTIGQYAFQNCTGLVTVDMDHIRFIDNYAFWNCKNLTTINSLSNVIERINGFTFYGCESLKGLTVDDLAKMGYVGSNEEIMKRVEAILAGKFNLDNAENIGELELDQDNWLVGDIGQSSNWQEYDNGTQIMQQARWSDAESGVAEVQVDAYYTGEKQMDYIFIADLSASMAQLGNPNDMNARFYDMQSKLLDMTSKLLNTPGYDCQVAIASFGGDFNGKETAEISKFFTDADSAKNHIQKLEPLYENTNYYRGLMEAYFTAKMNKLNGRNTVVVFLSDGAPNRGPSDDIAGESVAQQYKDLGIDIYGVLHSPAASQHDKALGIMNKICDQVYESTNTQEFGEAMNKAFTAVYGNNTITIPVNAEDFDVTNMSVTAGEVSYNDGIITWTLNGMPFTDHKLTYNLTLKEENANRVGTYTYSINNGNAAFTNENGASAGIDLEISRTVEETVEPPAPVVPPTNPTVPTTPTTPTTPATVTPATPATPAAVTPATPAAPVEATPIEDDATPMAQSATGSTEEPISDDENPLASVYDAPHCWIHYLIMLGMVLSVIYFAAVAIRRTSNDRKMGELERKLTEDREISYSASPAKHQA